MSYPFTTQALRHALRQGPYDWPGGYPLFFVTSDGGALCHACVRAEYRQVSTAIRQHLEDGWRVDGLCANYEDSRLYCDHCGEQIEAAYPADNLDAMTLSELLEFAERPHENEMAREYATTKARAMAERTAGNINVALCLESTCEMLYGALPDHLRW